MKRDMELIRKIVLAVQNNESLKASRHLIEFDGADEYREEVRWYHQYLIADADFATFSVSAGQGYDGPDRHLLNYLTWKGQEFADICRDERVWRAAIGKASAAGVSVSLGVLYKCLDRWPRREFWASGPD